MRSTFAFDVLGFNVDGLGQLGAPFRVGEFAKCRREFFDLAVLQPIQLAYRPALLRSLVGGMELARQVPEMLASMIEVYDLNRSREVLIGNVPDPVRPIAHNYAYGGAVPTPVPRLGIDSQTKLFGGFNDTHIRGRVLIAH